MIGKAALCSCRSVNDFIFIMKFRTSRANCYTELTCYVPQCVKKIY